jgi:hypothetical protein
MKYYVFIGRPVNAAYSLYDFMSNKRSTFVWGFPERNKKIYDEIRKEVENEVKGVEVVMHFYILPE